MGKKKELDESEQKNIDGNKTSENKLEHKKVVGEIVDGVNKPEENNDRSILFASQEKTIQYDGPPIMTMDQAEALVYLQKSLPGKADKLIDVLVDTIATKNKIDLENSNSENLINIGIATTDNQRVLIVEENKRKQDQRRGGLAYGGLFAGLFISILFLVIAWDLVKKGHDVAGTILGSIDIVGLASVFIAFAKAVVKEKKEYTGQYMIQNKESIEDSGDIQTKKLR